MNDNRADSVPGSSAADFIASQIVFPVMIAQRSHSTKRGFPFCYVPGDDKRRIVSWRW